MIDKEDVKKILRIPVTVGDKPYLLQDKLDKTKIGYIFEVEIEQLAQQICDLDKPLDREKLRQTIIRYMVVGFGFIYGNKSVKKIVDEVADQILALIPDEPKPDEIILECCGRPESQCKCDEPKPEVCPECKGAGSILPYHPEARGMMMGDSSLSTPWLVEKCPTCKGTETKPDDSRLLTDEVFLNEIDNKIRYCLENLILITNEDRQSIRNTSIEIITKAASMKDAYWQEVTRVAVLAREAAVTQTKDAECQAKVGRIFEKIENTFADSITKGEMTATNAWQALKKEEFG